MRPVLLEVVPVVQVVFHRSATGRPPVAPALVKGPSRPPRGPGVVPAVAVVTLGGGVRLPPEDLLDGRRAAPAVVAREGERV